MRIVHFDQMFHPEFGDQINILPKFQVKQGHEVYIVTGKNDVLHPRFKNFADNSNMDSKDKIFERETGIKIIRIDIKTYISGRAVYERGYKKKIDNLNPDILFCHFNDTLVGMYYTLISDKLEYPVVFDSHMLEMASKNPLNKLFRVFYKKIITPKIRKNKLKVIKTQDDNYVNKHLGVPESLTPFISFGSDTTIFKSNFSERQRFRKKFNISEDDFVICYAGKLSESKGIKLLAEAIKKRFNTKHNIVFLIIGNAIDQYEKEAIEMLSRSENRVIFFPTQRYIDLPKFYQASDLSVFPKQSSLSFYDVQACGLPVIAEDNSLNVTRLSHNNGLVFTSNDSKDLREKIKKIIEMSTDEYNEMSKKSYLYIKKNFDYETISRQYTDLLIKEYDRFHAEL